MGDKFLRQSERSKLAEKIIAEQQGGNDILVVPAQAGMLHRGCSARRTRASLAGNEFGLGMFSIGCMLLTHPERLSSADALMIDCGGDEYSVRGDYTFDRVPLFDYDIGRVESEASFTRIAHEICGARRRGFCTRWCDHLRWGGRGLRRTAFNSQLEN